MRFQLNFDVYLLQVLPVQVHMHPAIFQNRVFLLCHVVIVVVFLLNSMKVIGITIYIL